jgi:hypothetical protein
LFTDFTDNLSHLRCQIVLPQVVRYPGRGQQQQFTVISAATTSMRLPYAARASGERGELALAHGAGNLEPVARFFSFMTKDMHLAIDRVHALT